MIVYHIDLIEKECLNDTTNVIHLTGWCYSRKQDIQFSCYDNIYLEKEYPVSVSRNQRNDVSQVLDINSDCELGFSLDITLPDNANAILVIANEDAKITLPMEDLYLYPQCSNMAASSVWKELRDAATLKAEQLMLADPNLHIIYNFDIINKENAGDKVIYHLVGWCLSDEHPVQFTCCSSFDLQTQYCVDAEWVFRDDVNQLLAIDIERKLGFSIDITLPAQENGLLLLTCGAVKITFLLDELHSNCSNIATSELWKNMLAERRMKEEQEYLTNPHHHIIYNFDLATRESWNENTDIYNLAGWCYCGENPAQFACHDVNDPQKEYQVFISRNFRSDLNKALGIRPEHEPGFALVISMPTGAKGVLTITSGNYEIILPLEELHQPCSNIGISKLWKKLRSAAELMEQEQETPTAAPDKEKQQNSLLRHSSWGEHLLFVVHFADRTGAPLLALSIVEQLYKMGYNLHVIVLRDGELVGDLSKYARVYVAELENEEKFRSILVELQKYQIKNAFLNTTVSGYYAKLLKENNYNVDYRF